MSWFRYNWGYRSYPANYYLVNDTKGQGVDPDLTGDITKADLFKNNGIKNIFDVVVFEGLPGGALTSIAFQNAADVLKSGGL